MSQKILILLGSPRKKGNSATLAGQVCRGAEKGGADCETVYLNGLKMRPCQGCQVCQKEGANGCAVKDDMTRLYPKVEEADTIVLVSPIYWFNLSAQIKIFIDRLFAVGVGEKNILGSKNFSIVLTFADPDVFESGAVNALRSYQDMCSYLGASDEGMVYGRAGNAGEITENKDAMLKAYELGRHLSSLK